MDRSRNLFHRDRAAASPDVCGEENEDRWPEMGGGAVERTVFHFPEVGTSLIVNDLADLLVFVGFLQV
jgi:hypothetical protein